MGTRVFDRTVTVRSSDGERSEVFSRGERVKHIRQIDNVAMFEVVNPRHIAGTYVMDWDEFELATTAVREAKP
jgi:hypothetical protein